MGDDPKDYNSPLGADDAAQRCGKWRFTKTLLARWVALGVVVLNSFIVILAGLSIYQSWQEAEDRALVMAQNIIPLLESDLSSWFYTIDLSLIGIKEEAERQIAVGGINVVQLYPLLGHRFTGLPTIRDIGLASSDGSVTLGTGIGTGALNISRRPYFIQLRDSADAGLVISEPFQRYRNGEWMIVLARRLNNPTGTFAGAVIGIVTPDQLRKHFSALNFGTKGMVSLRALDFSTVVDFPEFKTTSSTGDKTQEIQDRKENVKIAPDVGNYATVSEDGLRRIVAYKKLDRYPYYISVGLSPMDYLFQGRLFVVGICVLSVLNLLILGVFLADWSIREKPKTRFTSRMTVGLGLQRDGKESSKNN
jgi:hypothetical protein